MEDIAWKTINTMFNDNPNFLIKHHIDSYNDFFNKGIINIFKSMNPIKFFKEPITNSVYKYNCEIYFGGKSGNKIYYGKPIIVDNINGEKREHYMYPNEARLRNMTYGFTIHYDVEIEYTLYIENKDKGGRPGLEKYDILTPDMEGMTQTLKKVYLGSFPIMLQSNLCILNNLTPQVRYNYGECRNDQGGYFIIDGKEKAIISQEGRADNMFYIKDDFNELYSCSAEIRSVSEDASKPVKDFDNKLYSLTVKNDLFEFR